MSSLSAQLNPDKMRTLPLVIQMIEPGSTVSCFHWEKEGRPAVVLRVTGSMAHIIAGSTKEPEPDKKKDAILVKLNDREAYDLGLTADTWFKRNGATVLSLAKLSPRGTGKCPTGLLLKLERLVGF